MRAAATISLAIVLVSLTGCGGGNEKELDLHSAIENLNARIDSIETSIRQLEKGLDHAQSNLDQVPKLRHDVDRAKTSLAEFKGVSDLLKIVSRKGDDLVVRGIIVANGESNVRCLVSPEGLAVSDENGQRVCEVLYDEKAHTMSASLRGRKSNSVALYAGEDRAAIGAYGTKGNGHVGWAASVTPEGQVMAGKAGR